MSRSEPILDGHAAPWPELALRADTAKVLALSLGAVALTLAGAAVVFLASEPPWSRVWLAGWGAMILFPFLAIIGFRQAARRGAVLKVGPRGVRDVRLSPDWIPWHAIRDVSADSMQGVEFLTLQIDPEFEGALPLNAGVRWARPASAAVGYRGLWINSVGLAGSFDEVKAAIASGLARTRCG